MRTLLLFLLCSGVAWGQIREVQTEAREPVGKYAPMGTTFAECERLGETYHFTYRDAKFQHLDQYKSFSFEDQDGDFDALYARIMDGFEAPPADRVILELPDDIIILEFQRQIGVTSFRFGHAVEKNADIIGFSPWMTKRQVQKLFGKR